MIEVASTICEDGCKCIRGNTVNNLERNHERTEKAENCLNTYPCHSGMQTMETADVDAKRLSTDVK